jgi:3-oxoacyl-[acyl-carrier-protein] synthase II
MKRIVITGMGMITPLGLNVGETWAKIIRGESGIGRITRFDTTDIETPIGGEVKDFDPVKHLGHKEARRMDRFSQFAIVSAMEALAQSGYQITPENAFDTAVVIGAGFGGAETLAEGYEVMMNQGPSRVKPLMFPSVISNMGAAQVAMKLGIRGVNYSIAAACATSALCIGEGARLIQNGDAEVVLAGGSEAGMARFAFAGLNAMRVLTTAYNDTPERASRPFDAKRDGFVPSEGAGVLVLESLEHAQKRGANILAELVGYGATCDASHISAPDPEGAAVAYAMRKAIKQAGIDPQAISYINAHGTSTPTNDAQETAVIKQVLGDYAYQVPISSTKSMTGHAMSSSGVFEAIFSVLAIREGLIPPTINLENPDPVCDLDYVPGIARKAALRYVLSNSFGFGGQNAVLLFKRWES